MNEFVLGFLINPIAGVGGSVALKGSDGEGIAERARELGAEFKANMRATLALEVLLPYKENIRIVTASGDMGEHCAKALGFKVDVVYQAPVTSSAIDSKNTVKALLQHKVNIVLFAGGDGTARDVCQTISEKMPVLGIPAGCKIHSGVYAITPKAAGRVIELMVTNQLVSVTEADVMDIDESLFRQGIVKAKRYGEMIIPSELRYVQAVKSGGKESNELVLQDIAAHVIDQMEDELFIIGSGSTTAFVMEELAETNTLLGVDIMQSQSVIANDVTEPQLWQYISANKEKCGVKLVITIIGGQGHIFGRGNQQLSPRIIKAIGKDNIFILATKTKLASLHGRPMIADTGEPELDQALTGHFNVITGYNDQVLYPVSSPV